MPAIVLVAPDGAETRLDIAAGKSVMQGAVAAGVDGIVGECGGELMCATCHVYVLSDALRPMLPPMSALEDEMLDAVVSARRPDSRLSCQIKLTAALDGLRLGLPDAQV